MNREIELQETVNCGIELQEALEEEFGKKRSKNTEKIDNISRYHHITQSSEFNLNIDHDVSEKDILLCGQTLKKISQTNSKGERQVISETFLNENKSLKERNNPNKCSQNTINEIDYKRGEKIIHDDVKNSLVSKNPKKDRDTYEKYLEKMESGNKNLSKTDRVREVGVLVDNLMKKRNPVSIEENKKEISSDNDKNNDDPKRKILFKNDKKDEAISNNTLGNGNFNDCNDPNISLVFTMQTNHNKAFERCLEKSKQEKKLKMKIMQRDDKMNDCFEPKNCNDSDDPNTSLVFAIPSADSKAFEKCLEKSKQEEEQLRNKKLLKGRRKINDSLNEGRRSVSNESFKLEKLYNEIRNHKNRTYKRKLDHGNTKSNVSTQLVNKKRIVHGMSKRSTEESTGSNKSLNGKGVCVKQQLYNMDLPSNNNISPSLNTDSHTDKFKDPNETYPSLNLNNKQLEIHNDSEDSSENIVLSERIDLSKNGKKRQNEDDSDILIMSLAKNQERNVKKDSKSKHSKLMKNVTNESTTYNTNNITDAKSIKVTVEIHSEPQENDSNTNREKNNEDYKIISLSKGDNMIESSEASKLKNKRQRLVQKEKTHSNDITDDICLSNSRKSEARQKKSKKVGVKQTEKAFSISKICEDIRKEIIEEKQWTGTDKTSKRSNEFFRLNCSEYTTNPNSFSLNEKKSPKLDCDNLRSSGSSLDRICIKLKCDTSMVGEHTKKNGQYKSYTVQDSSITEIESSHDTTTTQNLSLLDMTKKKKGKSVDTDTIPLLTFESFDKSDDTDDDTSTDKLTNNKKDRRASTLSTPRNSVEYNSEDETVETIENFISKFPCTKESVETDSNKKVNSPMKSDTKGLFGIKPFDVEKIERQGSSLMFQNTSLFESTRSPNFNNNPLSDAMLFSNFIKNPSSFPSSFYQPARQNISVFGHTMHSVEQLSAMIEKIKLKEESVSTPHCILKPSRINNIELQKSSILSPSIENENLPYKIPNSVLKSSMLSLSSCRRNEACPNSSEKQFVNTVNAINVPNKESKTKNNEIISANSLTEIFLSETTCNQKRRIRPLMK
ncbi:putative uncharacterized protein DDB_G0282133 [Diaphorina citri]|uniref:Uncharacterized protein n=1 Tax=Diaphorina citri TaxID=121845 RepID=A0A1S3DG56_DIACI|nr:putative uncharacterized protein DDB_G0282133 [Diaphorina citri]